MSNLRWNPRDLVAAYDLSLEKQIVGLGSSLACRDQDLWKQVEELLRDGDVEETHCLGLDPLRVMEESLKAEVALATATSGGGRVKARGGLRGLEKAFEVLEQAALNLYLGPWREEYKVVKMYSGMFTHHIKPVLSLAQIERMFGLLGYRPCSARREQLRLQPPHLSPAHLDDLLRLCCAFFLARCECLLLLAALGKHGGDARWELMVVRERQRGLSLQVALDNTRKLLEVQQPHQEPFDGDVDVDLYTDQHVNGGAQRELVTAGDNKDDEKGPRSLAWMTQSAESLPMASAACSLSTRDNVCISTLNYQLTKMAPLDSASATPASSAVFSRPDGVDVSKSELYSAEAENFCGCLRSPEMRLQQCLDCNALHQITCACLQPCYLQRHSVLSVQTEDSAVAVAMASVSPEAAATLSSSPPQNSSSSMGAGAMMSVLSLCDELKPPMTLPRRPIGYHDCCDLAGLDPRLLCLSCSVFHSEPCRDMEFCGSEHAVKRLGRCSCGSACSRKPLVLCRYCGNEYCNPCWYRNPVVCSCGQTFDQSSAV